MRGCSTHPFTLLQLCPNYMTLCVRIGKMDRLREQRRSRGRKITVTPPLFPGYAFVPIVSGWWDARWAAGVRRLVMDGLQPARVPDGVIDEIRSRERNGFQRFCRAVEARAARAGHAGAGHQRSAERADRLARSPASARAGARVAATAGRAATGRAGEERDRGG